eukprot:365546-Chlamydomonas_euryale.AAC.6
MQRLSRAHQLAVRHQGAPVVWRCGKIEVSSVGNDDSLTVGCDNANQLTVECGARAVVTILGMQVCCVQRHGARPLCISSAFAHHGKRSLALACKKPDCGPIHRRGGCSCPCDPGGCLHVADHKSCRQVAYGDNLDLGGELQQEG